MGVTVSNKIGMNIRWQTLILIILILVSFSLTNIKIGAPERTNTAVFEAVQTDIDSQKASLLSSSLEIRKNPVRNWEVLDPKIAAAAVIVQSLDENFPFFHLNTYKIWPLASLSKLLTAVVVLEEIGPNKKILITDRALETKGEAGEFRSGEIYTAQDLLKIMLLSSSNDAAVAFEDYVGGKDEFLKLLNRKANALGMSQTLLHDGSGLSDLNQSTASDILRLTKYILEREPEIFNWSRLPHFLVQPINEPRSRTVYNVNSLVVSQDFLGGKTGTSEEAKENLAAIFSLENQRVVMILLGSRDRVKDAEMLLTWVRKAYALQ